MTTFSYLISVTTSQKDIEVHLAIRNIVGKGHIFYGEGGDSGGRDLWIIPQSKKSRQEMTTQLQTLQAVRSVSIIPLSKPVKEPELAEVRELFTAIGWDTSEVSNEELSLFINAKLQNEYTYYLDFEPRKKVKGPVKIRIKLLEEHPNFSPDWLKKTDHTEDVTQDRDLTIDDLEITRHEAIEYEEDIEPPPPPHNLSHMRDEQIREWIQKERAFHHLKDGIIEIKRTSNEILITITLGDETVTIGQSI